MYLSTFQNVFVLIEKYKHLIPSGGKGRLVSLRAGVKPGQADCLKQCSSEGRGTSDPEALISIPLSVITF